QLQVGGGVTRGRVPEGLVARVLVLGGLPDGLLEDLLLLAHRLVVLGLLAPDDRSNLRAQLHLVLEFLLLLLALARDLRRLRSSPLQFVGSRALRSGVL